MWGLGCRGCGLRGGMLGGGGGGTRGKGDLGEEKVYGSHHDEVVESVMGG